MSPKINHADAENIPCAGHIISLLPHDTPWGHGGHPGFICPSFGHCVLIPLSVCVGGHPPQLSFLCFYRWPQCRGVMCDSGLASQSISLAMGVGSGMVTWPRRTNDAWKQDLTFPSRMCNWEDVRPKVSMSSLWLWEENLSESHG